MNSSLKKIGLKITKIILALIVLVFLIIGIALNFVITSDKITPKVIQAVNENLNAEMQVKSIELSFFKTFPNFTLEVTNGAIINHLNDSLSINETRKRDTLISFDRCQVTVSPWAFLRNKIVLNHLIFENPQIYAYINANGDVNWDILKSTDSVKTEPEKPKSKSEFKANIDIRDVQIKDGYLFYENGMTDLFTSLENLNLTLKAKYNAKAIELDMDCQSNSTNIFKKKDTLLHDFGLGIASKFAVNRETKILTSEATKLKLNDAAFVTKGTIFLNKERKVLELDVDLGLENASIENLMGLLPASIINKQSLPKTKGDIELTGKIKGDYGKNIYPGINAALFIKNGEIAYNKMPNKLDKIETEMHVFVDPTKEKISSITLNNCLLQGKNTNIQITGELSDLFGNSTLQANLDGKMDLGEMQKTIPLKEGIHLQGILDAKTEFHVTKEAIKNKNYGNIKGKGHLHLNNFLIENSIKQTSFATKNSRVEFIQANDSDFLVKGKTKVRGGRIDINNLVIRKAKQLNIESEKAFIEYGTIPSKDSTSFQRISSKFEIKKSKFNLGDTLKGQVSFASGDLFLSASKANALQPAIRTNMQIDSAGIKSKESYFAIKKGNYRVESEKNDKNQWPLDGDILFESMVCYTPSFPLVFKMPETKIKLEEGVISLHKAEVKLGRSDFLATGKLINFGGKFFRNELMKADLSIQSNFIDVNQIIKALNVGEENEVAEEEDSHSKLTTLNDLETADSTSVFIVPAGIELEWNTTIKEAKLGKFTLKNLRGLVTMKDQKVALSSFNMITNNAKMATSATYEAKSKQNAHMKMDFKLVDINLANLIDMFPVLDSIMPMASTLQGNVNFRMKGESALDANLGMVVPELELIARIQGKNMVVLDSETFQKLAKMLFFKDKKTNVIDEMSFALVYKNGSLEVFPSEFEVDRYRLAVGGIQKINGNYSFHVSVLKTPIPLVKMGIDVTGSDQGSDFKLARAKYKLFFAKSKKRREKADQELMQRKQSVIDRLPF